MGGCVLNLKGLRPTSPQSGLVAILLPPLTPFFRRGLGWTVLRQSKIFFLKSLIILNLAHHEYAGLCSDDDVVLKSYL